MRLARRQVDRLTKLVNDMVEMVHLRSGQIGLRTETVPLGALLEGALAAARGWTDARRQTIVTIGAQEGLRIRGDPDRLEQMLGNLLHNASKFSDDGQTIALAVATEAGHVRIDVRDDGAGIAPARLAEVFDPFAAPETTPATTWHGGLGVGLPVARDLAELHGGRLTLHSDGPGRGTTASLWLPLDPTPTAAVPPAAARATRPLRILLVDDNTDLREGLAAALTDRGHETVVAANGAEALAAAGRRPFDVIFLDIGLPDVGGHELAARLRRELPAPLPLLVAMSGYDADSGPNVAGATPFDHRLLKPIDPDDLSAFLKAARHG